MRAELLMNGSGNDSACGNFPRSMTHLSLAFLGTFQASLADQPITHFRSSNVQGLLVFLVLQPGRSVPRDVLATLFWSDEPDHRARANLRQSLYQLRKLLEEGAGSFLTVTRQTVRFNPDGAYQCDVHDFLQALELGELAKAVTSYGGELLPGRPLPRRHRTGCSAGRPPCPRR